MPGDTGASMCKLQFRVPTYFPVPSPHCCTTSQPHTLPLSPSLSLQRHGVRLVAQNDAPPADGGGGAVDCSKGKRGHRKAVRSRCMAGARRTLALLAHARLVGQPRAPLRITEPQHKTYNIAQHARNDSTRTASGTQAMRCDACGAGGRQAHRLGPAAAHPSSCARCAAGGGDR